MPRLEIQVDSDRDDLHMLNRPAESHLLVSHSRQEWGILLEGCLGKAFTGTSYPGFTTEVPKAPPGACTGSTSRNIYQFGGFSENEAAALRQTGWGEACVDG